MPIRLDRLKLRLDTSVMAISGDLSRFIANIDPNPAINLYYGDRPEVWCQNNRGRPEIRSRYTEIQ